MQDIKKWNEAAADYQKVFLNGISDYNRQLLGFLADEGMLRPGCRVIDVGCGIGKYGTYFAAMGCDVTLTDISPGMLKLAEKNIFAAMYKCAQLTNDHLISLGRQPHPRSLAMIEQIKFNPKEETT